MKYGPGLLDTGPLVRFLAFGLKHHSWVVEQWKRLRPPLLTCERSCGAIATGPCPWQMPVSSDSRKSIRPEEFSLWTPIFASTGAMGTK